MPQVLEITCFAPTNGGVPRQIPQSPNMCVDLTPGIEMYFNFSAQPEKTREFFLKYQDRIIYGTDIGAKALLATPEMGIEPEESRARIRVVRNFLERQGEYNMDKAGASLLGELQGSFRGISLPQPILEKIYFKNFERLVGLRPRHLNPAAIVDECERLELMIGKLGALQPGLTYDTSIAQMVKSYFLTM